MKQLTIPEISFFDYYIDDNKDSANYEFRAFIVTDTDIENKHLRWNDTLRIEQKFYNYYAYDDGSAEAGYGLYGEGVKNGKVAYKFNSHVKDSLRSIRMYFNLAQNDANVNYFILKVWDDNNGEPGNELISQLNNKPEFEDELNQFVEFDLDTIIALYGDFYIGWQQTTENFLNIGFDNNNFFNDTVYYGEDYQIKIKIYFLMLMEIGNNLPFRALL